jgi:hypothetical protein
MPRRYLAESTVAPFGPNGRWVFVGPVDSILPFIAYGDSPLDAYQAYETVRQLYAEMMEKRADRAILLGRR